MQVFSLICVTLLYCICVESNSLYNDRYGDRSKSRYTDEDQQMAVVDDPPPPVPYAPNAGPYFYQRVAPLYYGDFYRPRQRYIRYMDDRPVKRSDYYLEPQRRQCRSPVRRRSAAYARNSLKYVPSSEEEYYASDSNSPSRSERIARNDMYSSGTQDGAEHDEMASGDSSSNSKFADDKYPTVLANFKIGSKLDKKSIIEPNKFMKREYREKDSGGTAKVKANNDVSSFDDIESDGKVAEELRDILDYMGLIDEDSNPNAKAAIEARDNSKKNAFEDENMEEGNNKISLNKEERGAAVKDRNKREDKSSTAATLANTIVHLTETDQDLQNKAANDKDADKSKRESKERTKRQDDSNSTVTHRATLADVPLAESSNANEYEKRVERQIQTRINALKDEVKREIAALKAQEAAQAVHNLNEDTQRKKRQAVSTLIEEENSELDPALHPEGALKPHIRKRRHVGVSHATFNNSFQHEQSTEEKLKSDVNHTDNFIPTMYSSSYTSNVIPNSTIKYTTSYLVDLHRVPIFTDSNVTNEVTTETFSVSSNTADVNLVEENSPYRKDEEPNDLSPIHLTRRKRDVDNSERNYVPVRYAPSRYDSSALAYLPGRSYISDEEEGELDYDGFYDVARVERASPYLHKRSTVYNHRNRRANGGMYERKHANQRTRRDSHDIVRFHGGGPAENQFSSLRTRTMSSFQPRVRRRRANSKRDAGNLRKPQTLNDMSETDIFGALPQSYDGELNRFKRVRRSKKHS